MTNDRIDIGAPERAAQAGVIELFDQTLGYEYLGNKTDTENYNICTDLLWAYLDGRGCPRKVADAAISKFQAAANDLSQGLYAANKAVYELLKYGVKVPDGHGGITTVYLINFDEPKKNDFQFAEEVTVNGFYDKRPDIVVFVNGIALGVIELKRGSVSVMRGICQNIANQKEMFIKPFFTTMQLVTAGNSSEGLRYGTIETPAKQYLEWRHDGFADFQDERDPDDVQIESESAQFDEKLDSQVYEMFNKKRFLSIIRNFIVFDRGKKKVARYSQYYGIKRALSRTPKGKGGIIWHSQGTGKSIEMVVLAKLLVERDSDGRVLIVTDRDELDEQIEKLQPIILLEGTNEEKLATIAEVLKDSETGLKGVVELRFILDTLKKLCLNNEIQLDLTLARGLNYYTGAIFEVKALDTPMGSISGGGRYDNLTGIFGLPGLSGVGISFGVDRIYDVLDALNLYPQGSLQTSRVLFINFGEKETAYCLPIVAQVRQAGIRAELFPDAAKMKKQMSYANAKQIPFVVLAGDNEIAAGKVTLKDMVTGEQLLVNADELIEKIK